MCAHMWKSNKTLEVIPQVLPTFFKNKQTNKTVLATSPELMELTTLVSEASCPMSPRDPPSSTSLARDWKC